jgi:hypothetical protein
MIGKLPPVESKLASFKEQGATLEPKTLTADGHDYKIAFIEDPHGYKIELVQRETMEVEDIIR